METPMTLRVASTTKFVHEVGDIPGRGRRMSPDGDESTGPC
jgi:hypothetical protein